MRVLFFVCVNSEVSFFRAKTIVHFRAHFQVDFMRAFVRHMSAPGRTHARRRVRFGFGTKVTRPADASTDRGSGDVGGARGDGRFPASAWRNDDDVS